MKTPLRQKRPSSCDACVASFFDLRLRATQASHLLAIIAICASFTTAAVIHKIDDTSVTGTLAGLTDGKITLKDPSATIPLDEISQITIKEPPAPPAPQPVTPPADKPPEDDSVAGSVLSALFGSKHRNAHTEEVPAPPLPVAAAKPATVPTSAPVVVVTPEINEAGVLTLTDGDQCHATLLRWQDQKLAMKLATGSKLDLPSSVISEIWLGSEELKGKAKKLSIDPGPEDIALVSKDDGVVAVKGLVQGMNSASLLFRYDDQDRKISRGKVVGLLLRSNSVVPITAFHQLIHTDSGDQFSGTLSEIDHDAVVLNSPAGVVIRIPLSNVTIVDFLNGRVTYLTDLKPTRVEQTPYFGRVIPYRTNVSLAGGPIMLSDGPCPRGLAVHSRCVLEYDVSGGFDRFKTKLGFEQPDGRQGRVLARVLGDGKSLYENPDARGDQPPIEIDVPTAGVHTLTLEIDFGRDQNVGDRVVWGNPRLLRGK